MPDALNASWTAVSELVPRLLGAGLVLFADISGSPPSSAPQCATAQKGGFR